MLVIVAVPVMLLGTVAPYANRLTVQRVSDTGKVTGRLYALSTAGSLVGTFAAALLLIPLIGTHRTFLVFAVALAAAAAVGLRSVKFSVPALVLAGLLAIPPAAAGSDVPGARVIYSTETQYQYARVLQLPTGERWLQLNEGVAIHSDYKPWSFLTGGYWDDFLVLPLAGGRGVPGRVAILGDAAGTVARAYGHYFPDTRVDAVELDGALSGIGRRYFALAGPKSASLHRGRAAVAGREPRALRRDLPRRLPPAVHPVLPGHPRVLRARALAPARRRDGDRERGPSPELRRAREGRLGDAAGRVPRGRARRGQQHQLARDRQRRAGVRFSDGPGGGEWSRARAAAGGVDGGGSARGRAHAAGPCTRTTGRRSSG